MQSNATESSGHVVRFFALEPQPCTPGFWSVQFSDAQGAKHPVCLIPASVKFGNQGAQELVTTIAQFLNSQLAFVSIIEASLAATEKALAMPPDSMTADQLPAAINKMGDLLKDRTPKHVSNLLAWAIEQNDSWHRDNRDEDNYIGSELCELNVAALAAYNPWRKP